MHISTLSAKQNRFVAEYLVDGNGTQAAIRAQYGAAGAGVAAMRLLKNVYVQKALQARQNADATRLSLAREDVLAGLLEAAALAKAQLNPSGMVAAWKQVGLLLGFYTVNPIKMEVSIEGHGDMNRLARMSDAELVKIIEAGQVA